MGNLTASHKEKNMTNQTPLPLRNDTILGVCEAIGQEFGFNPLWLRLAFVVPVFFAPMAAIAAYLGLGAVVAATRWLVRDQNPASPPQLATANSAETEVEELAIAA